MPQQVKSLGRRGLYNQVFQRGELPFLRIQCRESYPPPSRLPARSVRGRAPPALAHPPPVRGMSGRGWLVGTGGGFYFSYIKFFKGAGLGCRLGRSWTVPSGHHFAPTEPAGETLPPSLREVPPEAAEGVKKGDGGQVPPLFYCSRWEGIPLRGRR